MVDQLSSFASEVTRVAREGTEGKLGGQAQVREGRWHEGSCWGGQLDGVTAQVRGIARVVTAVANGDLRRIDARCQGERPWQIPSTK